MTSPTRWRSSGTWPMPMRRSARGLRLQVRQRLAVDEDLAAAERADAGERLEELRLAVARDAGDAEDFAFPQDEGDVVDANDAAVVAHHEVARLERDPARMRGALVDLQDDLAPDHRVGELRRRGLGGIEGRDHLAAPHHRHAVGQAHDLAQLVGDEDDRLVLALEHPQHLEQLVGLGRRQHRGRLVEHQDFRAAHQRLQDLDPLLQADRQFADDRVGIDLEAVFPPELGEPLADRARALGEQRAALGAEHDVLEHAERRHQHEMLMHHADAVADRLARGADPDRLAVDADFAGVGFVEAVENRHQRRFAGAVLADDAVDDAALDDEIDVIVGVNRAEALVDADQLDGGRGFIGLGRHARSPVRLRSMRRGQSTAPPSSPRALATGRAGDSARRPVEAGAPGWLKLRLDDDAGLKPASHRALVVGHVVVNLDLARDDVGLGGVGLRPWRRRSGCSCCSRRPRSRRRPP